MIMSMTGFGSGEASDERYKVTVEIRSVNHRYLDLSVRLPRRFNRFEGRLRTEIRRYAQRGKIDVSVNCEEYGEAAGRLRCDLALASEYLAYIRRIGQENGLPSDVTARDISLMPDVLTMVQAEEDEEYLWGLLLSAFRKAGETFRLQRGIEGANLKEDLLSKLDRMAADVAYIERRAPEIIEEQRARLTARIRELTEGVEIDESRILTEVAIYADKTCVDEETVRLRSHIDGMRSALTAESDEAVGRRLDFIAQEMNREANTTLSKSDRIDVSEAAVRLKTEIEKIREQVQNVE